MPDEKLTPEQFGQRIKAKNPGAYDDIPDAHLAQKVLAKYPQYADMVSTSPAQSSGSTPWYKQALNAITQPIGSSPLDVPAGMQPHAPNLGGGGQVQAYRQAQGNPTPRQMIDKYAAAPPTLTESNNPFLTGVKKGVTGAARDTFDTTMAAYSPAALALGPASQATKEAGAVGSIARTLTKGAGVGFGATGATGVYNAGTQNTPEAWQQRLQGGAMVAGGLAGLDPQSLKTNTSLRGALESRMAQVPVGERFSRAQVVDAASQKGVNLDLAQATESGILNAAKKANRYSLASQGTYDTAATKNLNALEQWADSEASKYSPDAAGREVVGPQVQSALKNDLEAKKASAQQAFNEIDQANGSVPVDVSNSIATEAQKIIANNKDYYAKHPELKPGKAWAILEDLASKTPGKPVPKMLGNTSVIDALGSPVMQKGIAGGPKIEPWSDLHQLRSDLMDFYRNNPDIVKGRSEAWIQQMVGKIDESMTSGASGLSPENLAKFRQANDIWGNIKSTYDNPQSPYYHAVRSGTPSQVPGMLAKGNPELAKSVRATLGSLEGPFQRQFVENLLNDKSGALDLRNLNSRLSRVPDDFLVSMLGEDGANNLRMLGKVSQKVTFDANPSGTAKVGVPAAEVSGFFSNPLATGAELATQRVGAKLMNSPKVLNYLTKKK